MLSVIWAKKNVITLIRINRPLFGVSEILKFFFIEHNIQSLGSSFETKKRKHKELRSGSE